jgi:hypothetical protein
MATQFADNVFVVDASQSMGQEMLSHLYQRSGQNGHYDDFFTVDSRRFSKFLSTVKPQGNEDMLLTLATILNKSGVAPRTAQEIMRHSDIRLTMKAYTDAKLLNVSGALDKLPKLSPAPPHASTPETHRATGTNGKLGPNACPDWCPKPAFYAIC